MAISLAQHRALFTQALIAVFTDNKEPNLGLSAWFPHVTKPTKYLSVNVRRSRNLVAVDVQRCTDPHRNLFTKSTEKIYYPPFFSEMFDITACEGYDLTFGKGVGPNAEYADMMINDLDDRMQTLKNNILRAIEKQRASVLQYGVVTMKNGDTINYGRQSASMVVNSAAGDLWSNAAADILGQIRTGVTFIRRQGLTTQGAYIDMLLGTNALTNLYKNTAIKAQTNLTNQIVLVDIKMPKYNDVTGLSFHGQFSVGDAIIRIWTYDGWYENNDGSTSDYIDPNMAILIPADFIGVTGFAGVPTVFDIGQDTQRIAPKEGDFITYDLIDQRRKTWDQVVESAPLVVPVSIDRLYSILTVS